MFRVFIRYTPPAGQPFTVGAYVAADDEIVARAIMVGAGYEVVDVEPAHPVCDHPTCQDPYGDRHGHHYHCGRCDSGDVTGQYGHCRSGAWFCPAPA